MRYAYRIEPGKKVDLSNYDPGHTDGLKEAQARAKFADLNAELAALQEELFAAAQDSVLVVLQAPDTGGKDGTIRNVFRDLNPQGVKVEGFKVPTEEELAHDFLWRAHKVTPRKGIIGVFNRSYYEDVLVVRVHKLAPEDVWKERYGLINDFEKLLYANGTMILKFFLYISKDEQKERLLDREKEVEKAWKLSAGDWHERELWSDYMKAYEDVLGRCSTRHAPWFLIPANHKWYRDLAVCEALVDTLKGCRKGWDRTLQGMATARLAELADMRAGRTIGKQQHAE